MTEKEKMLLGEIYDANYDKELLKEREIAQDLCFEYNNLRPSDFEKEKINKKDIRKNYRKLLIEQPFWCDYGYNIEIGKIFMQIII